MEFAARPWMIFAVSLIGAATVSATPAREQRLTLPDFKNINAWLAADSGTIMSLQDVLQTASANAQDISDHFWYAFFPALQQEIVNRVGLVEDLIRNPLEAGAIGKQFLDLIRTAVDGHFTSFVPPADAADHLYSTLDGDHQEYFQALQQLTDGSDPAQFEFLASPMSGVLWGNVDAVLSPIVQFGDDVFDIVGDLAHGDFTAASQELSEIPANVVDAFLNGYGPVDLPLPLSALVPGAQDSDATVTSVNLGGLLSPGGSFFDALGLNDDGTIGAAAGEPVGVLGSLVEMQQAIAVAVGWDGIGNPIGELFDGGI